MKRQFGLITLAAALWVWSAAGNAVTGLLDDSGENFGPGDNQDLAVGVQHTGAATNADVYLALVLPDGTPIFVEVDGALRATPGTSDPSTWRVALSALNLPSGINTGLIPVLSYGFTGAEPVGRYKWILAFTEPNTLNVLDVKTAEFFVAPFPVRGLLGNWTGSWTNQTFGSTGSAVFSLTDKSPGVIGITVDLGGNVLGVGNPPAFGFDAMLSAGSGAVVSGISTPLGTVNAQADASGNISGSIGNVSAPGIDSLSFSGSFAGCMLNLSYTVQFSSGPPANGTLSATRQGCQ